MAEPRVTIEQIALHLGLSKFSVSRALSGKSGVGPQTRARIVQAASRLGYHAGGGAAPAMPRRQLLFVMQDHDPVGSELWINMLHGAEREAAAAGFAIVPRQIGRSAGQPAIDAGVAGLILAVNAPDRLMPWAARTGLPVVCGGYGDALGPADRVVGADWEGGVAVGRYLVGHGHRRIGFVRGEPGLAGRGERWRGLCDATAPGDGTALREIGFAEPNGFREAFLALVRSGFAPTALFCAHDGLAITVISELLHLGLRVPEDVSVVGFNDFVCATQISPQLTTIRMPQEAMGTAMVRCLAARLAPGEGIAMPPLRVLLVPEFVERRSAGPAAPAGWAARLGDPALGASLRREAPAPAA